MLRQEPLLDRRDRIVERLRSDRNAGRLFHRWLWKEKLGQANFGADIVLEPTDSGEIVEDISSDRKILSEWNLKLEMAPQEVIFT